MSDRIEINPDVMQGKPVVRGTRVPVELLLRKLAEGASPEDLVDAYPRLTPNDIRACLEILAAIGQGEASLARCEGRRVTTPEQAKQIAADVEQRGTARLSPKT